MKVVKKAKKTPMLKIGEDIENSQWYKLEDNVIKYVYNELTDEDIENGVEVVDMKTKKKLGSEVITYLTIKKSEEIEDAVFEEEINSEESVETGYEPSYQPTNRDRSIIAQSVGNMTSRVVAHLIDNSMDTEEVKNIINEIYELFYDLVMKHM